MARDYSTLNGETFNHHRLATSKEISGSFWVHYNPATKEFKAGLGTTHDLNARQLIVHSSQADADSTALALGSMGDDYKGFISVMVTKKTTFELSS